MSSSCRLLEIISSAVSTKIPDHHFISYFKGIQYILNNNSNPDYVIINALECQIKLLSKLPSLLPLFFSPENAINIGMSLSLLLNLIKSDSKQISKTASICLTQIIPSKIEDKSTLCSAGTIFACFLPGVCSGVSHVLSKSGVTQPRKLISNLLHCLTSVIRVVLSKDSLGVKDEKELSHIRRGLQANLFVYRDEKYIKTAHSTICEFVGRLHFMATWDCPNILDNLKSLVLLVIRVRPEFMECPQSLVDMAASLRCEELCSLVSSSSLVDSTIELCRTPVCLSSLQRLHAYISVVTSQSSLSVPISWTNYITNVADSLVPYIASLCSVKDSSDVGETVLRGNRTVPTKNYMFLSTPRARTVFYDLLSTIIQNVSMDALFDLFCGKCPDSVFLTILGFSAQIVQNDVEKETSIFNHLDRILRAEDYDNYPRQICEIIANMSSSSLFPQYLPSCLFYLLVVSSSDIIDVANSGMAVLQQIATKINWYYLGMLKQ